MDNSKTTVLAFDFGTKRIGVARANLLARFPEPLDVVENGDMEAIKLLIAEHDPQLLIVGRPRSLDGNTTDQTKLAEQFAETLKQFEIKVVMQDEALTSVVATQQGATKSNIDSVSAGIILSDYLDSHK